MRPSTWQTSSTPARMLGSARGLLTPRQLRLFACACVRSVARLLRHTEGPAALDAAEAHADGLLADDALGAARRHAESAAGLAWMKPYMAAAAA